MVSVEQNSILKKTFAVFMLMITAFVFLSFGANAQGITYQETKYNSQQVSGVTANITVTRYYANNVGTAAAPGSSFIPYLVYIQLYNNNDSPALVNSLRANIVFNNNNWIPQIWNINNFTEDLVMSMDGDTVGCRVSPSSSFSYGNGIVVPPKKSLYLIAEVQIRVDWEPSNSSDPYSAPVIDSVNCGNFTVGIGDYNYGNAVDLSSVVDVLDDIEGEVDNVETLINSLINSVAYTGTTPNINPNHVYQIDVLPTVKDTNDRLWIDIRRYTNKPVVTSSNTVINPNSDTYVSGTSYYIDVLYSVYFYTRNYEGIYLNGENAFRLAFPNYQYQGDIVSYESDIFSGYWQSSYNGGLIIYNLPKFISDESTKYVAIPSGYHYLNVKVRYTFDNPTTFTYPNLVAGTILSNINNTVSMNGEISYSTETAINEIKNKLQEFIDSYNSVNGVDDSSDISNDVSDVSDSNHIIEESYYSANASAIQATGLSNYRFSNEQNNGIGKVANDFMLLWNALGSWNGVYIFSLTLALATFIMRHGGLFTIKRQTSDKGGEE